MKELCEVAGILAKKRLKKIEIINNSHPPSVKGKVRQSRDSLAYHALIEQKFTNDAEMAKYLGFKEVGNAYYSFKRRFQEKLINGLFHVDVTLSGYYHAENECSRLRHAVYMMLLYGCRNAAMHYTNKIQAIAEKYNLAEYKVYCYKILREHFSYTGDHFRYSKNTELYDNALEQMIMENKAEDFLNRINVQYARTIALKPELAGDAFGYADEIAGYVKMHDSPLLQHYEHKLRGLAYQIAGEYEKALEIWQLWEQYLHNHPLFSGNKRFGEAAIYQMDNYTYLFQYDNSINCAAACMKYFREDSTNRLIFLENYFLLAMRSGDYVNAKKIFGLATKNARMPDMPVIRQEKWKIFEAYMYFVENETEKEVDNKCNVLETLKDVHVYEKDKAGFNVSMLIIQICILLMTQPEKPLDKMDALKLYKRRYLKKDISYRVNIVMDLLFALDKSFYEPANMKNEEVKLLKKLINKPLAHTENIEGLEVIPFEKLWGVVSKRI